jgi:hypothetical protein
MPQKRGIFNPLRSFPWQNFLNGCHFTKPENWGIFLVVGSDLEFAMDL